MKWFVVVVIGCLSVPFAIVMAGLVSKLLRIPFSGDESREAARTFRGLLVRFTAFFTGFMVLELAVGTAASYPVLSLGRPVWRTFLDAAFLSAALWFALRGQAQKTS